MNDTVFDEKTQKQSEIETDDLDDMDDLDADLLLDRTLILNQDKPVNE